MLQRIKKIFKKIELNDVFTPTTAAKINFVKREKIEDRFLKHLSQPGMQIVIFGASGGGKTTLTTKLLATKKIPYITTSCIEGITVNQIILEAFDLLNPFYTSEKSKRNSGKVSSSTKAKYLNLQTQIQSELSFSSEEKQTRVLPVQLTPRRLAGFMGEVGCIWIIEDFHKVRDEEKKKLSQIMKIFYDMANEYRNLKIIALGAAKTARQVVEYDSELTNRIAELEVPLFSDSEISKIIRNGCQLLNVELPPNVMHNIIDYSNHLAAICHQLCFNICYQNGVEKKSRKTMTFGNKDLKVGIANYVEQKSDSFEKLLDRALKQRQGKFENSKLILKAIIDLSKEDVTYNEIFTKIQETHPTYPNGNLTTYLKPLLSPEKGEILRYDENSGKYSFSNPFFRAYVKLYFQNEETEAFSNFSKGSARLLKEFLKILEYYQNKNKAN